MRPCSWADDHSFDSGSPGPDRQARASTALTSTVPSPSGHFSTTSGSPHLRHIEPAGRVELGKNSNGGQAFRRAPPVAQTNLKTSMIAPPPPRLSHGIPEFPDKLLMRASPARCAAQGVDPRGRECLLRLFCVCFLRGNHSSGTPRRPRAKISCACARLWHSSPRRSARPARRAWPCTHSLPCCPLHMIEG